MLKKAEDVIARSEATKQSPCFADGGDCFAPGACPEQGEGVAPASQSKLLKEQRRAVLLRGGRLAMTPVYSFFNILLIIFVCFWFSLRVPRPAPAGAGFVRSAFHERALL